MGKRADKTKERALARERQRRQVVGQRGPRPDFSEVDWGSLSEQDARGLTRAMLLAHILN
jgi:hypothetical protein